MTSGPGRSLESECGMCQNTRSRSRSARLWLGFLTLALRDDESPNLAVDRPKVDAGEARVLSLEEVKGAIVPGFAGQLGQLDPPTVFFIDGILNVMGIPVRNLLVHKT
eukprot:scaffold1954_cov268-Pinguiococcus_pyrenoidosus.AAC.283